MKIKKFILPLLLGVFMLAGLMAPGFSGSAYAATQEELQAQITSLLAQIAALQAQIAAAGGTTSAGVAGIPSTFRFNNNLSVGSRGLDVAYLQIFLNASSDTRVNIAGAAGGPGSETQYFGALTRAAVIKFQNKYASEILIPVGLTQGTGFVGVMTRAKLNALLASVPPVINPPPVNPPPVNPPPAQVSSTLSVTAAAHPSTTLLPPGAVRIPMLRINLVASGPSAVTVSSMTVQLGGLIQTGAVNGAVLLDESGNQIGLTRFFGTNRQAIFTEPITVSPGTPRVITVGINMNTNLSSFQGQSAQISLTDIHSNAVQTIATLPIFGPAAQVNSTFPIGTATVSVGSTGGVAATRDVGTTGYDFASIRINAGSQEDVILKSIRFTQNGSASASDVTNVKAMVDGTSYPATVSGRTYLVSFGNGIRIASGLSKEVSLRGDISSGVGRTIEFDIDNDSDINITGANFGFGLVPTATVTSGATMNAEFTTGTPFFSGSVITITGGAVNISRATSVPAQNISVNVPNQVLGGFDIEVVGEAVTVNQMQFSVNIARASGSSATVSDIHSVTLVSGSGSVVAGPVDASGSGTTGTITFNNVFLPAGRITYTLKGTLGTSFRDGDVVTVSLVPSTALSTIRGQSSGNTVSAAPSTSITAHPMTVRSATITASLSPTPVSQSVVAGAQNFTFANIQLDATASGEDIRFSSIPITFTHSGSASDISGCRLSNGSSAVTSGGNVINPSSSHVSGTPITFTFDSPVTVSRGTVTTLTLQCNVSSSATNGSTFSFGISSGSAPVGTGVQSGQTITANTVTNAGATMTVAASGTFTVSTAFSSPAYQVVAAGSTEVIGALTFRAGNEAVNIQQVALQLTPTGSSASSSPADISSIALLDSSGAQIGTAFFSGSNRTTTVQLTGSFVVPANSERDMNIRATFSQIGPGQPGTEGDLVKVDYDGDAAASTRGAGQSSGSTLTSGSSADSNTSGARVFKTIPTINSVALSNTTLISGDQALARFSVTADANGALGIQKFSLDITPSSGVSVTDVTISGFNDSGFSSPAGGNSFGRIDPTPRTPSSGLVEIYSLNSSGASVPFQVPAGTTRYFEVRGTVTGATTGSSVSTKLLGDSAYMSLSTPMGTVAEVDADANDNLIWSPNLSGQSATTDRDWTNVFGVRNLPSTGLTQTLSR